VSRLLVATRSRGKQAEFRQLLASLADEIVFPDDLGIAESPEEDALEVHDSFEANALAKAEYFAARGACPALADDSGLEVDALNGAPGVWSKRFAGAIGPDHEVTAANNAELLRRLEGAAPEGRTARYRCVLALAWPPAAGRAPVLVAGWTNGTILTAPEGSGGFGYDPLFRSDDLGIAFASATPQAKHAVSHRGRAVAALLAHFPTGLD
jgi:XTP/dITP diphosphohydrolase